MSGFKRSAVALSVALVLGGLLVVGHAPAIAADVRVAMQGFQFVGPDGTINLTIAVGTRVIWINNDPANHTTTSDATPTPLWDSGSLPSGASFSFTFNQVGTFPYHCTFHGGPGTGMHGTVTVVAAATAPAIAASPAQVPFGQNSTTITWNTGGGAVGQVCVAVNGGAESPFAGGASGSQQAGFINSGTYIFALHDGASCTGTMRATVTVTKLTPKGTSRASILATQSALSFATSTATLVRSATISFDTGDGSVGQVMLSVNGSTPQLYASAQFGTVPAPWIFSGAYTFTLMKGGQPVDVATAQTTAEIASPNGTTSGGPSPNVATTNGTAVLLTFDTGNGQAAALCTNFGGLVSFSQNGAGFASVNNSGTVMYDLHIGSCSGAKATQGTVTITSS